jgi:hypothetical protein
VSNEKASACRYLVFPTSFVEEAIFSETYGEREGKSLSE